jgi:hypothetical protein
VLSQPVGNGVPAAPGAGDAAAAQPKVLSQPVGNGVPAVVRKAGPTTGAEAAPGGNLSVIPVAPGGGYSGTPGFTASGGNVSPTAGVSAALAAAADRGDFKSIADHYQKGGGTFNGETAADVRAANLREQISMAPVGSKRRAALVAELQGDQATELAKGTQKQAGAKLIADLAQTKAQTKKAEVEAEGATLANQTRQRTQEMLSQLAQLDNTNDPDGSQRRAIQENLLVVMHGKDPQADKIIPYDIPTGGEDPITGKPHTIKGLYNARKDQPVGTPKVAPESNPKALEIRRKVQAGEMSRADGIKQLNALRMKN